MSVSTLRCILCKAELPPDNKPEHILLDALGGRATTKIATCPECNNNFGSGPDQELAKSVELVKNSCLFKSGSGSNPPTIKNFVSDGHRFDIRPGMSLGIKQKSPLSVAVTDNDVTVSISAYSDADAENFIRGAATAIAKKLGRPDPKVISAIEEDIAKDRKTTFQPAPIVKGEINLGSSAAMRAMAKACLVLWTRVVGNEELQLDQYDSIRAYINDGYGFDEVSFGADARPIPPSIPYRYSAYPNFIWVGSNGEGTVYGYFRLYGAVGWGFKLRQSDAPPNKTCLLISNPFENHIWDITSGDDGEIENNWFWHSHGQSPEDAQAAISHINRLLKQCEETNLNNFYINLMKHHFQKLGYEEGDLPSNDDIIEVTRKVAAAMAAQILRREIPTD
ncbi:HNH endonuclease [Ancylobacter sp. SL191]|uniref:HNH endonuclease n=1 Tax=Ancylobacter sp. SL191 TaxID=2995166 RepID=UPI0022722397|nr:HNH endonuclease [Ancylobacter sp. SL191]WAC27033.1 hypothetical protein OU996_18825 [Ancylobacter sp. SL191]